MLWSKEVVATHHPVCLRDVCSKHVPTMPLVNRVTVLSEDRRGPARRVCAGGPYIRELGCPTHRQTGRAGT
jgi:hypothetical protein